MVFLLTTGTITGLLTGATVAFGHHDGGEAAAVCCATLAGFTGTFTLGGLMAAFVDDLKTAFISSKREERIKTR